MDEKLRQDSGNNDHAPSAATEERSSTPARPLAPGMRFSDALLASEIMSRTALDAALAKLDPKSQDLPSALVGAGVITPDQAKSALFLQMVDRYRYRIEGFEIEEALGQGAVGSVFKAYEPRRDRHVAVKILDERLAKKPEVRQAFVTEARAALRLNHPNIVQGYDVGEANEISFYIMELVEGRTVDELVSTRGPMDERQALNIMRDLARALEHAEENGLVHRDIKPANIIVGKNRIAKLLDMGLAKVVVGAGSREAERGAAVGTPNYMSPEQIRGDSDIGSRADIYSMGATLFFMMTGQPPFAGKPEVVMYKHIHEPPASPKNLRPECSDSIVKLIFSMMAKKPDNRPSTATALIEAIDLALSKLAAPVAEAPPMLAAAPPMLIEEPEVRIPTRKRVGRRGRRHPMGAKNTPAASESAKTPSTPAAAPAPEPPPAMASAPVAQPTPKAIPMEQFGKPIAAAIAPAPEPLPAKASVPEAQPTPKAIPMEQFGKPTAAPIAPVPMAAPKPGPAPQRESKPQGVPRRRRRNMR